MKVFKKMPGAEDRGLNRKLKKAVFLLTLHLDVGRARVGPECVSENWAVSLTIQSRGCVPSPADVMHAPDTHNVPGLLGSISTFQTKFYLTDEPLFMKIMWQKVQKINHHREPNSVAGYYSTFPLTGLEDFDIHTKGL